MSRNETITIIANTIPKGQLILWSFENTSICTIDSNGVITAKSVRNTMITGSITYAGTTYSSSCNIIVGELKVTLSTTSLSMYVGDTQSIIALVIAVDGSSMTTTISCWNGLTMFSFYSNIGFVANRVTLQFCGTTKSLQSNGTYEYTTYTDEINMSKIDVSHWSYNNTFTGFSAGSYLIRCRAYNGSSSAVAYATITIN